MSIFGWSYPPGCSGPPDEDFDDSEEPCSCVYATSENTESVRKGFEMGGYLKVECDYCKEKVLSRGSR